VSRADNKIRVQRVINAPPEKIFDILADPAMHPVIDGSDTVKKSANRNPKRLSQGAKFGMGMKIGAPYRIRNTVVEFEEGKKIAWRHFGRHRWRYELELADGGTRVTETFDYSTAPAPFVLKLLGFTKRHPAGMAATLERLDAEATKP
jgi:uncharacterized protein YndB with AHSA1/START domain